MNVLTDGNVMDHKIEYVFQHVRFHSDVPPDTSLTNLCHSMLSKCLEVSMVRTTELPVTPTLLTETVVFMQSLIVVVIVVIYRSSTVGRFGSDSRCCV
jgi:hypothetical protein